MILRFLQIREPFVFPSLDLTTIIKSIQKTQLEKSLFASKYDTFVAVVYQDDTPEGRDTFGGNTSVRHLYYGCVICYGHQLVTQ